MSNGIHRTIRRRVGNLKRAALRNVKRARLHLNRLDQNTILRSFKSFDSEPPKLLFVHSSLSACGYIVGGSVTVIQALLEWTDGNTLAMPTHTYCYPDQEGRPETFDPLCTPSRVGAVTDYFWRQPGVMRSLHPTHSLAASGPLSEWLCNGHERCGTPCGSGTPYERLIEADCAVLMFGATMNSYTLFHTAEDAARVPYLYEPKQYRLFAKSADHSVITVQMFRQDMSVPRRFRQMADWLEERDVLSRRRLGAGELLFVPSSARVHQVLLQAMDLDPYFLAEQVPALA